MSFKQKNIAVTFANFSLILMFYTVNVWQMIQSDSFTPPNMFRLFGWVAFFAVVVTVVAIILTHIIPGVLRNRLTGQQEPIMDDFEDERDQLIDLRGTRATYTVTSFGSFVAMLTYIFGMDPLVMFTLLIFFGVLAQMIGDATRLMVYRKGF
jgi:hypothetical protein